MGSMVYIMQIALKDLELDTPHVIYPGQRNYLLSSEIRVWRLEKYMRQHFDH